MSGAATMGTPATRGTFRDILAAAAPQMRPVCAALRALIAGEHGGYVEIVWPRMGIASFGVGPKKMSEHYAYIAPEGGHVNLGFYHGTALADPMGLLEGTGKKLRHIKIRDACAVANPAVAALLRRAIADRKRHAKGA